MEANDLRIGNVVLEENAILFIESISKFGVNLIVVDLPSEYLKETTFDKLKPIELTEEILLKCGYIACSFRENHFVIKGHTIWKCNDLLMCDKNGIVVKHLHQLQNLYFALTNEELEINL